MSSAVLQAKEITKFFHDPYDIQVLKKISFEIQKGEFTSIIGKSGCGKSTLLYILSTMDTDYEGDLIIDNQLMRGKKEADLARVRNEKIGFVFQFHYLLNEFSVIKNVMLPGLKLNKLNAAEVEQNAYEKLRILGIQDEALKLPNQLSGGQKQRVAIARALINNPLILMGDEPTGNLDKKNTEIVFEIFKELAEELGQSLLIVTHDNEFAERTHRIIEMEDGTIIRM
jgi:lipoprotein-releasing system ATP-binding protein